MRVPPGEYHLRPMGELRLGTSGWSYPEWVGKFYPNGTQPSRMLDFYSRIFRTVEAHSTYRRLPEPAVLERWVSQVPEGFKFVPKVHMGVTHRRDLDGIEERVDGFINSVRGLGPGLGPVLFSLPHQEPDLVRLDRLLNCLPKDGPVAAFDLGPAWAIPTVFDRLDAHGATLVLTDSERAAPPTLNVGPIVYIRLRRERYDRTALESWAERLAHQAAAGLDGFVFLKHDDAGDGPRYARRLAAAVASHG